MRRTTVLVFLSLGLLAVAAAAVARPAPQDLSGVPRISQRDFKKALSAGSILVIDVRDAGSYANGHIPGAISMPLSEVEKHLPELKSERRPIVTYCA